MSDNLEAVISNATDFFARAQAAGLDFRMGVAGMRRPGGTTKLGKFCSDGSGSSSGDGGADRFLTASEKSKFIECVRNPPYSEIAEEHGLINAFEAVTRHLPRAPNDPTKIRTDASLALIFVSDEFSQEFKEKSTFRGKTGGFLDDFDLTNEKCTMDAGAQPKIDDFISEWVQLFTGKHPTYGAEAEGTVHVIGGVCGGTCSSELAVGYSDLAKATRGITADVCQPNLGPTLQALIDTIVGQASPTELQYVPISSSLAVAWRDQPLSRSRVKGFDFNATSNTVSFSGLNIAKGDQLVVSYRRWEKQISID